MELEQQVCSLELAKKLKELGVKQDGLFAWLPVNSKIPEETHGLFYDWELSKDEHISAYTVAELGEMLAEGVNETYGLVRVSEQAVDVGFETAILPKYTANDLRWNLSLAGQMEYVNDDNEANARAKMLIYLIENSLITL